MRWILLALLLLPQDDATALVEKLRSGDPEVRESAARSLKALGKGALATLEKASRDSDKEVAARASQLLRALRIRDTLTPAVLKAYPDLDDVLASPDEERHIKAFQDATEQHPEFVQRDLEPLAAAAAAAARGVEFRAICAQIEDFSMHAAIPALVHRLDDPDTQVAEAACATLVELRHPRLAEEILRRAKRHAAWEEIRGVDGLAWEALTKTLGEVIKGGDGASRIFALGMVRSPDLLRPCTALLEHDDEEVRAAASEAIENIGSRDAAALIEPLLSHKNAAVRCSALHALGRVPAVSSTAVIKPLLEDPDLAVRSAALYVTGRFGTAEDAPRLRPFLKDPILAPHAALALASLGDRGAIDGIKPLLTGSAARTAATALRTLGASSAAAACLVEGLKDPDPARRTRAVEGLEALADPSAANAVVPLLKDPDESVRKAARQTAIALNADAMNRLVIDEIAGPDRTRGLLDLSKLQNTGLVEALLERVKDPSAAVRAAVVERLGDMRDPRAFAAILPLRADPEESVRREAEIACANLFTSPDEAAVLLKGPEAPRVLMRIGSQCLLSCTALVREALEGDHAHAAITATALLQDQVAIPTLRKMLGESYSLDTRRKAIVALESLGDAESVQAFLKIAANEEDFREVRTAAIHALGTLRGKSAGSVLAPLVDDRNEALRAAVMLYFASCPEAAPTSAILRRFTQGTLRDRRAATEALCAQAPSAEVRALLADEDALTRVRTLYIVQKTRDTAALPAVERMLRDPDPLVRDWARRALLDLAAGPSAFLTEYRRDPNPSLARALVRVRAGDSVVDARGDVLHPLHRRREAAAIILGGLGGEEDVTALERLLKDPAPNVRTAAVESLAGLCGAKAVPILRAALRDIDPGVRRQTVAALGWLGASEAVPDLLALIECDDRGLTFELRTALEATVLPAHAALVRRLVNAPPTAGREWTGVIATAAAAANLTDCRDVLERRYYAADESARELAEALAWLESDAGVGELLSRSPDALCALRYPEVARKLRAIRLDRRLMGRPADVLVEAASLYGFDLKVDASAPMYDEVLMLRPGTSLWYALTLTPGAVIVAGEKSIRIMDQAQACRYWREWLDGRKKK